MKPLAIVQKSMTLRTALLIYAVGPLVGALAFVSPPVNTGPMCGGEVSDPTFLSA